MNRALLSIKAVLFGALMVVLLGLCSAYASQSDFDLPSCKVMAPGGSGNVALGIVDPYVSPEVVSYAVHMARLKNKLVVCEESWSSVLPRWVPWSSAMERGYGFGLFLLAFLLAVLFARCVTPRRWWRKPTLTNLLFLGATFWIGGVVLLAAFHTIGGHRLVYATPVSVRSAGESTPQWHNIQSARELEVALNSMPEVHQKTGHVTLRKTAMLHEMASAPKGRYRVHQWLNLRQQAGVNAMRLAVLPTGELVMYDGERKNDWWRVKTASGQTGWVSSIWLRRPSEGAVKQ